MESLYVVEQGCRLQKSGTALNIVKHGRVVESLPARGLAKLVLTGNISLTGPVMDHLIRNRVETVFLTPTGRFRARLMIDEHRHVALRQAQYIRLADPEFKLKVMKTIVEGKLSGMTRFLMRRGRDYREIKLKSAAAGIKSLAGSLAAASSPESVRGVEGAGARIYFSAFSLLLRNKNFHFPNRNRRPPKDPVNALLSFVYTLLINEVISAIKTCGLDPYLGALHEIAYGRPSLACDLVEEYRCPVGDRFVLSLLNREMIHTGDFLYRDTAQTAFADEEEMARKRPVEMRPHLYRTFISAFETLMKDRLRTIIRNQVRAIAAWMLDTEKGYTPYSE